MAAHGGARIFAKSSPVTFFLSYSETVLQIVHRKQLKRMAKTRKRNMVAAKETPEEMLLKDGVVTIDEAAEMLRVDPRTVERMLHDGQLPRTRARSKPLIPKLAIIRYLADGLVPATV